LSKAPPVSTIEVSLFVHATEDLDKVMESLKNVLGDNIANVSFHRDDLQGHYGNPIIFLKAKIREDALLKGIMEALAERIENADRGYLLPNAERCTDDKGIFFLRLDKQAAYLGRIAASQADPIHIKIRPRQKSDSISTLFQTAT
jgi:hypothetical protein